MSTNDPTPNLLEDDIHDTNAWQVTSSQVIIVPGRKFSRPTYLWLHGLGFRPLHGFGHAVTAPLRSYTLAAAQAMRSLGPDEIVDFMTTIDHLQRLLGKT